MDVQVGRFEQAWKFEAQYYWKEAMVLGREKYLE